eukprot:TRINITY_DN5399_c0_g1_i1.p1 TRINITY_DN5399_c0_g1~~TRINITY_DN5399_c0_g1_i1.p1  ORF type:complete len:440 (+),score=138.71 TRINITY_DN5399_c0_g1_i1:253-1572(+)
MSSQFRPDSSSLVDLKAEVYRKKEEAKRNKARVIYDESQYLPHIKKSLPSKAKESEAGVHDGDKTEEEDESYKVQEALRKKAALYDHLKTSKEAEDSEGLRGRFLVEFKGKSESDEENDDDFVEYTDPLGRTRMVRREELRYLKEEDTSWCKSRHPPPPPNTNTPAEPSINGEEDLKRELLREKWAQEEEENLRKRDVHYGDVLFNEARSHGTGYYGFSREEVERSKEIDALKDLHKETKEAQKASQKAQKTKDRLLAARLKKVRERKRLKMGLPIRPAGSKEAEEDPESTETTPLDESDEEEEEKSSERRLEESIASNVRQLRDKRDAEDRKRKFVREWDLGKVEATVMSQDEWVREKRTDRTAEFAPSYSNSPRRGFSDKSSQNMSIGDRLKMYKDSQTCSSNSIRGACLRVFVHFESISDGHVLGAFITESSSRTV